MDGQTPQVSSPNSTGGGGTHFEQHVGAAFLVWLLVRAIPPVLTDTTISEVHLQTERLGWKTDDLIVVGANSAGQRRTLVCQVKQTVKISSSDEEFTKTIVDAWGDFSNEGLFDRKRDRIAIITLRGTDVFLKHFAGLLDCARASRTHEEFANRLETKGLVNAKVVAHQAEIQKIIERSEGKAVDGDKIWEFLRILHALSFDLNTSTRQTEAQVQSLLAYTAGGPDPVNAANSTWNDLLREVGEGKPQAKSYTRDDLEEDLRQRHSPIGKSEHESLQRLKEHSSPILDGIRSAIGPTDSQIELPREHVVHTILEQIHETGIVLVSGSAGSGKSAVARRVLEIASPDYFTFTFRAEEFAVSHLDETLRNAQLEINGARLGAVLSGQAKKVLLIESVERLLEATTRDAFADLLTLLKHDPSWRIVLTCRDYSAELVRTSLLKFVNVPHGVVPVPPLDEDELDAVSVVCPAISDALANRQLRKLLSNPYMLDKATQMPWPKDKDLPQNERAFREKFWTDIVRANDRAAGGMPRRREGVLVEIALRRAKALTLYAARDGLDDEAVDKLIHDSLVNTSQRTDSLVAPAHDVLEDWAILSWIDGQYERCNGELPVLSETLGTFPAIRRSYRKWLAELVGRDSNAADHLFSQALTEPSIPSQFRDDTLVSLLRSPEPNDFVQRHTEQLFSNDKNLLRRLIRLLRVGCLVTPDWFAGGAGLDFDYHVPDGMAWPCILDLVGSHLNDFDAADTVLLLGLVEDAAKAVSWRTHYPPGSDSIAAIAYWLLQFFSNYQHDEELKRTLSIIAKLPKCDESRFRSLLVVKDRRRGEERDRASEEFRELLLSGVDGDAACRDYPDAVIELTRSSMLMTEERLREDGGYLHAVEMEAGFGINPYMRPDSFPPSAYQGPFYFLLRHHFARGTAFLIELFNHSAEWYRSGHVPMQFVEPPYEIQLVFNDGGTKEQWANGRLWNFYRGTSVGPYSLMSALMAFERQLLEIAEVRTDVLDALLLNALRKSDSAAITAVAASVAVAHPHACPQTLLVLLRSRDYIQLDRARLVHESQRPSQLAAAMPFPSRHRMQDQERKEADELAHRSRDIEQAIVTLQLGPHAQRVQEVIDQHLEAIPPTEERSEEDRLWLLALRRMDLRKYEMTGEIVEEGAANDEEQDVAPRAMIRMDLQVEDPDVLAMSEESAAQHSETETRLGVHLWGIKVFEGDTRNHDPSHWKEKLRQARDIEQKRGQERLGYSGPEFVAAVCVRDHFDELPDEDACWCVEVVCGAIEATADQWHQMDRIQRSSMEGDRPCAWAVSALIGKPLNEALKSRVQKAMTLAATHANDEVRAYAADGIGRHFWNADCSLALRCVNAIAYEATTVQSHWTAEEEKPFGERRELAEIEFNASQHVRAEFYKGIPTDSYEQLDVTDWTGAEANCRLLTILKQAPDEQLSRLGFERLARVLVGWWDEDDERRGTRERRQRSENAEVSLPCLLEDFVLRVDTDTAATILEPILKAMDRHPREVSRIIQGIIGAEDRIRSQTRFWPVWQLFADRVSEVSWLIRVDSRYSAGRDVFATIFLTQYWKDDTRHWEPLTDGAPNGNAHRVHNLFDSLPPTSILLDNYVRFLYHIGESCLPDAFVQIASKLQGGDALDMLRRGNTVFMLESLLRRFVHSRPIELKSKTRLRESVLYLLDTLVEAGSSSAYRMRDDFVTPVSQ